ncbi:hypothetical protein [uncultured Tissierella sp.]|uniref:hypothetical protein n=1 Tax=uncultured Tissierella sp. TaxID=448160 RepID=UPI0028046F44|nr:hypothetical protein [uncultured Tissierella sp.]MDU5080535.1 hypothetical protein [Bacillota bacterium]
MIENLKERYNNNRKFQKNIWNLKIFEELTEKQEIVLKIIYFLENIFKEDLRNICFYLLSDDSFDTTLRKLRDEGYIFYERKKLGTIYALTNKSIQKFEPFNQNYTNVKIGDKEIYSNKIKGSIIAKQINSYILYDLKVEFLNQGQNKIEIYILNQFIKNFRFKDFIQKTEEERINELKQLKSLKEDTNLLLKMKTYNEKAYKIYYKFWIQEYKIVQQDKRYLPFRIRFLQSLENMDYELRYYLKDFSKEVFDTTWKNVLKSFLEENDNFKEEYITKQFIKNKEYKKFLNNQEGDQIIFLNSLGFKKEEIKEFFNLSSNDINRIEMLYVKMKDNLRESSFKLFKDHFYNVLKKEKTRYHSEYLSDYKKSKFTNIENIVVNYFKEMNNNYLKDSNSKILSSLNRIMKELQISNENITKVNDLEKYQISYELFSYYERSIKKLRNDLLKKEDNELVDKKNKELEEIQKNLQALKRKIEALENELSFRLLDKVDGEEIERAFTFRILQKNSIFIDNMEIGKELVYGKNLNNIKVNVSFLDNTENGLQPFLIFRKIFIIHTFLNQLINREGVLDLHINIYTFNQNRKELLYNRLILVKNKMEGHRQAFGMLKEQITTMDTTIGNFKLWEFYNTVKTQIEEGGQKNDN